MQKSHIIHSIIMTTAMTFVSTSISSSILHGFTEGYFSTWMNAWGFVLIICIPVALILSHPVGWLSRKVSTFFGVNDQ